MFMTHPSELHVLKTMTPDELRAFAMEHGWRSVRRVGGRQIEFYNDATVRRTWPIGSETTQSAADASYLRFVNENVAVVTALGFDPALKATAFIVIELVTRNSLV